MNSSAKAEPASPLPGRVRIGCPVWAHAPWRGHFFTADARREDFLPQYARVFPTAEGNSTFYALPPEAVVARWAAEAPADFRFCFKVPRAISHDQPLEAPGAAAATAAFLARLAPLRDRLGPSFLQLPSTFGPDRLPALAGWLEAWPSTWPLAVEVRHPAFFAAGTDEAALDQLLQDRRVDRVVFDTEGLFRTPSSDPLVLEAKRKKPRVPRRESVTGRRPFVRYVGPPIVADNEPAFRRWAEVLARWSAAGLEPWFFAHHPDDTLAPPLARQLQQCLHELDPSRFAPPPAWPGEAATSAQLELFN